MKQTNLILLFLVSVLIMGCSESDIEKIECVKTPKFDMEECGALKNGERNGSWITTLNKEHIKSTTYNIGVVERETYFYEGKPVYYINYIDNIVASDSIFVLERVVFDNQFKDNWESSVILYFDETAKFFNVDIPKYKINEDWKNTDIASATLYFYAPHVEYSKFKETSIIIDGKLNKYVLDSMTKELRANDIMRLKRILTTEPMEKDCGADTYEPYNGIVMRDSLGEIVGHMSVCIPCGNYILSPHMSNVVMDSIREIFKEYGFPTNKGNIFQLARSYNETN